LAINIDLEEFAIALKSSSDEIQYYLNAETGSVVPLFDGQFYDDDVELEEVDGDDIDEMENYVPIEEVPSHEAFKVMEGFVESLPEGIEQIRLSDAIHGGKPFRRFKDILSYYPHLRDQWFAFEMSAYKEFAERWLEEHEIEATLVERQLR